MNVASFRFLLLSLSIHLALFWLFMQNGSAEYGVAPSKPDTPTVAVAWTVGLAPEGGGLAVATPHQVSSVTELRAIEELPVSVQATDSLARHAPERVSDREYVIAGSLTRLPVPITDIDLNVAGINDSDITGKVELTLLVDSRGTVVDVIPAIEVESARAFAERIAARFRIARFKPGEINGKAVNAQLRITVVSESIEKNPMGFEEK